MNFLDFGDNLVPGVGLYTDLSSPVRDFLRTPDSNATTPQSLELISPEYRLMDSEEYSPWHAPLFSDLTEKSAACTGMTPNSAPFKSRPTTDFQRTTPPITPSGQILPDLTYSVPPQIPPLTLTPIQERYRQDLFPTRVQTRLNLETGDLSYAALFNNVTATDQNGKILLDCRLEVKAPSLLFDQHTDYTLAVPGQLRHTGKVMVGNEICDAQLIDNNLTLCFGSGHTQTISLTNQVTHITQSSALRRIDLHLNDQPETTLHLVFFHHEDYSRWLECLLNPILGYKQGFSHGVKSPGVPSEVALQPPFAPCSLQSPFAPCYQIRKQLNLVLLLPLPEYAGISINQIENVISRVLQSLGLFDRLAVFFYGTQCEQTTGFHRFGSSMWVNQEWRQLLRPNILGICFDRLPHIGFAAELIKDDLDRNPNKNAIYTTAIISDSSMDLDSLLQSAPPRLPLIGSFYGIDYSGSIDNAIKHLAMKSNGSVDTVSSFDGAAEPLLAYIRTERSCVAADAGLTIKVNPCASIRSFSLRRGDYDNFEIDQVKVPMGNHVFCPVGHVREGETYCLDIQIEMEVVENVPGVCLLPLETSIRANNTESAKFGRFRSDLLRVQTVLDPLSADF